MKRKERAAAAAALGVLLAGCGSAAANPGATTLTARGIAARLDCTHIAPDNFSVGLTYALDAIACSEPGAAAYNTDTILTFRTLSDEQAWANDPDNSGSAVVGPLWVVVPAPDNSDAANYEGWVAHTMRLLGAGKDESLG